MSKTEDHLTKAASTAETLLPSRGTGKLGTCRLSAMLLLMAGMTIGYIAGLVGAPCSSVKADVTEEPRRDSFKAGGVLNEPVLRDISATLKRMETRLEQIEKNTAARASDGK